MDWIVASWGSLICLVAVLLVAIAIENYRVARHLSRVQRELTQMLHEVQALSQSPFEQRQMLTEIAQIKAGLAGISRPLIRSLRNTVLPRETARWGDLTASQAFGMRAMASSWPAQATLSDAERAALADALAAQFTAHVARVSQDTPG